jgi:hypothetical protein
MQCRTPLRRVAGTGHRALTVGALVCLAAVAAGGTVAAGSARSPVVRLARTQSGPFAGATVVAGTYELSHHGAVYPRIHCPEVIGAPWGFCTGVLKVYRPGGRSPVATIPVALRGADTPSYEVLLPGGLRCDGATRTSLTVKLTTHDKQTDRGPVTRSGSFTMHKHPGGKYGC